MKKAALCTSLAALSLGVALSSPALAAGAPQIETTNWTAMGIFLVFVLATLVITFWAAKRKSSRAQFYTAGGGITGLQNGLAIAGDFMSAASFLGISAMVYSSGYDGLIYSIGFLVGWPIIMFLMAERLRNLGRFNFADVVSYRLGRTPTRVLSAANSSFSVGRGSASSRVQRAVMSDWLLTLVSPCRRWADGAPMPCRAATAKRAFVPPRQNRVISPWRIIISTHL